MLPQVILSNIGACPDDVEELYIGENRSYIARNIDNNPVVIKKMRTDRDARYSARSEAAWLDALSMYDFPCVNTWHGTDSPVMEIGADSFIFYELMSGDHPEDQDWNAYKNMGILLRQLHDLSRYILDVMPSDWPGRFRPVYDEHLVIDRALQSLKTLSYIKPLWSDILKGAAKIRDVFPDDRSFIHGDFHAGNILSDNGRLCVLDFDESGFGPVFYDLGTMKLHALALDMPDMWQDFIKGYGIDSNDSRLNIGAAARILFMMGKIPQRQDVPDLKNNSQKIIEKYAGYFLKLCAETDV